MDTEKIIAGAAVGISAAALVLAGVTANMANQTKSVVSFDTRVKVASASADAASTEDTTAEEGSTESEETGGITASETDNASTDGEQQYTGGVNIVLEDGVIKLKNSVIKVPAPGTNGNENVGDLYLYLSGTNQVTYDSTTNYLVVNENTIVRTINAIDATYEGISQFVNEDGSKVLIGEKAIDENTAIAVVYTVPGSIGLPIDTETESQVVQNILDGAFKNVSVTTASLFGYSINPEWVEDMIIADEGLELIKGTKAIYVTPYSGTFASGTTNTLPAGNVTLTYSENIRDDKTGYVPYILDFSESQDGTATSSKVTMQAKILSQSNLDAADLFTIK